jgi:hypothetical protein
VTITDKELRKIARGAWMSKDEWEDVARELLAARKVVRAVSFDDAAVALQAALDAYDKARKGKVT